MKFFIHHLIRIFALFVLVIACDEIVFEGIIGDGNVKAVERSVKDFNGIKVASGIDVLIKQDNVERLVLEADENLHQHIRTFIENGILKIDTDKNIKRAKKKVVYLKYKDLSSIKISSAGDVIGVNKLHTDDLKINLSSAGDLELDIEANAIDINISSAGDAKLKGKTKSLEADLSSAGSLNAYELRSGYGNVRVSSSGSAKVYISDEAKFRSSSAGSIYYKGNPKILEKKRSSAGNIKKKW